MDIVMVSLSFLIGALVGGIITNILHQKKEEM